MAFDAKTGHLFVAAWGNNTVEIVDVNQGKRPTSVKAHSARYELTIHVPGRHRSSSLNLQ
jgi:hypothetical protein